MPTFNLFFPILGNPHGRVLEAVTDDQDPPEKAVVCEILTRYGDLFPSHGIIEIYESLTLRYLCDYATTSPGEFSLKFRSLDSALPEQSLLDLFPPN